MLEASKMNRLNQLAKKKKEGTLTEEEQKEQEVLRQEYLAIFRKGARQTIENMTVIDPEGNDVTPDKIKALRDKIVH